MIADIMAEYGGRLLVAIGGVGLGLVCLVAVLKYLRQRNGPSPFVRGGRPRAPRLQIVDAAAVDTRRRLVLVRRDEVEHLIMIGGPTDVVIESNIAAQPALAPALPFEETAPPPAPRPARMPEPERLRQPEPAAEAPPPPRPPVERPPLERLAPETPVAERPAPARPARPLPERPLERPLPVTPQAAYSEAADDFTPVPAPRPAPPAPSGEAAALKEAEEHLEAMKRRLLAQDAPPVRPRPEAEKPSGFARVLDDEMKAPLRDAPRPVPPAIQQVTRRELQPAPPPGPVEQPVEDPKLQEEIARIFGDKR